VTPLGFDLHFDTRNGVFFSALFFAIGVAFSENLPRVSWKMATAITCGGLTLFYSEALYLKIYWGLGITTHDYLLGSVPLGIGVSLLALTQPDTALDKFFGFYGRYVLGIYVSQLLFIDLFKPMGLWVNPIVWQFIFFPILVFSFSLIFSITTSRILAKTFLRQMVL
jgi:hypothetical protein